MTTERLRVLMVGPDVAAIGGMGSVALTLAQESERDDDLDVRLLASGGGSGRRGWLQWPGALARSAAAPVDLVHLHVASQGSTCRKASFAAAAKARGIPYVIHLHGAGYVDFLASLSPARRRIVQEFFQGAARVITLGTPWRDLVLRELHTEPSRTVVVANGVAEVPRAQEQQTIVHLGELSRRKGVDVLLDAAETVLVDHPTWRLQLVGPTPEADLVERARALSTRLGGRVEVLGPKFGDEKIPYLSGAGVFVLASRHENLPMAILEAMSAGVPVVVTPVGAIPEVVRDDENGRLVPAGDAATLARCLDDLLSDAPGRQRLGAAGRDTWRTGFSSDAFLRNIERVWRDALASAPAAPAAPATRRSIDVIIPTIGRDSLTAAVDSVLQQSTDALDVRAIVVNDSGAPLGRDLGEGVLVVESAGRTGVSAARNLGLAASSADFFALLDDDDVHGADHLATAVATLDAHGADVYFCRGMVHHGAVRSRVEPAELLAGKSLREYLLGLSNWRSRSRRVLTSTVVVTGRWRDHRFDETMAASEDTWFLISLEDRGALVTCGPGVHATMYAEPERDAQRRTSLTDPHALERHLGEMEPEMIPGYLVGRYGRAAARAGDPRGVVDVARQAREGGGGRELVLPLAVELGVSVALGAARLVRR